MRIGLSLKLSEPKYNVLAQNIRALFADGSQGWWYDDNDTTTLFQDSAGTTPVTAVEQFVGLQLDKSKGLVLGPDIIVNGDYSAGTANWTAFGTNLPTLSAANNQLTVSLAGPSGSAGAYQAITTVIGKWYIVRAPQINLTGVSPRLRVGTTIDGSENANVIVSNNSNSGAIFLATSTTTYISLRATLNTAGVNVIWGPVSTRELPGNHRYAPASGNRPIWSKRVNLLTKTEQFDDAVWVKGRSSVAATNTIVAPDGTLTAEKLVDDTQSGTHRAFQTVIGAAIANYSFSVYVKAAERTNVGVAITSHNETARHRVLFDLLGNGSGQTTTGSGTFAIQNVGDGWYRCSITGAIISGDAGVAGFIYVLDASGNFSYTGTGTNGIFIWGADLRPANQATGTMPLYQRVNTSSDYDTNGFPGYLKADGVDDFLQTNSIDFNTVTSDGQPRRNLLLNPTQFDDAYWTKTNATVTANATTAPDGTLTADKLVENTATSEHSTNRTIAVTTGFNTFSIYAKAAERTRLMIATVPVDAVFDLSNGTVVSGAGASITNVGNGWYRCSLAVNIATSPTQFYYRLVSSGTTFNYTGDGTSGIFIWGAQLEVGSTATAFQNIGTDKITLCAGVRKLSDAARAMVTELGADVPQSFQFNAPSAAATTYSFASRGSAAASSAVYNNSAVAAPVTNVATGIGDISGDSAILRINGTQVAASTTDQGTGNYGNLPAYFFHRNTSPATLRFNGYEYGNIAVGKLLTADQLTALETYMNGLTKAY